jgi:hypothetical protein
MIVEAASISFHCPGCVGSKTTMAPFNEDIWVAPCRAQSYKTYDTATITAVKALEFMPLSPILKNFLRP